MAGMLGVGWKALFTGSVALRIAVILAAASVACDRPCSAQDSGDNRGPVSDLDWVRARHPGLVADEVKVILVGAGTFKQMEMLSRSPDARVPGSMDLTPRPEVFEDVGLMYAFFTANGGIASASDVRVLCAAPSREASASAWDRVDSAPQWADRAVRDMASRPAWPTVERLEEAMASAIGEFSDEASSKLLVVFFSCHGIRQLDGVTDLALGDAEMDMETGLARRETLLHPEKLLRLYSPALKRGIHCLQITNACFSDDAVIRVASRDFMQCAHLAASSGLTGAATAPGGSGRPASWYVSAFTSLKPTRWPTEVEGAVTFLQLARMLHANRSVSDPRWGSASPPIWPAGMPEFVARLDPDVFGPFREDITAQERKRASDLAELASFEAVLLEAWVKNDSKQTELAQEDRDWIAHARTLIERQHEYGRAELSDGERNALNAYREAIGLAEIDQAAAKGRVAYQNSKPAIDTWRESLAAYLPAPRIEGVRPLDQQIAQHGIDRTLVAVAELRARAPSTDDRLAAAVIVEELQQRQHHQRFGDCLLRATVSPEERSTEKIASASGAMDELERLLIRPYVLDRVVEVAGERETIIQSRIALYREARRVLQERLQWQRVAERASRLVERATLGDTPTSERIDLAKQALEELDVIGRTYPDLPSNLNIGGLAKMRSDLAELEKEREAQRTICSELIELMRIGLAASNRDEQTRGRGAASELQQALDRGALWLIAFSESDERILKAWGVSRPDSIAKPVALVGLQLTWRAETVFRSLAALSSRTPDDVVLGGVRVRGECDGLVLRMRIEVVADGSGGVGAGVYEAPDRVLSVRDGDREIPLRVQLRDIPSLRGPAYRLARTGGVREFVSPGATAVLVLLDVVDDSGRSRLPRQEPVCFESVIVLDDKE